MCVNGICSQSGRGSMRWNFDTLYKVTELEKRKCQINIFQKDMNLET